MYILGIYPPIIPILMLFPVLIALHIDKKKIDHPIASNIILSAFGFLAGSVIYLGISFLPIFQSWDTGFTYGWNSTRILGIILPVLFGGLFLYLKGRRQIKFFDFTRNGLGTSALYVLFTVIPFLLPWFLFFPQLEKQIVLNVTGLAFPVLFGLWLLLSLSNYTWKYFLTYTGLAIGSAVLFMSMLFLFSAQ